MKWGEKHNRRQMQGFYPLALPPELAGVPTHTLKDFLSQFSRLLLCQLAPDVPDQRIQACLDDLLNNVDTGSKPLDVRLEFKHVCKYMGCNLDECQLCRNNPNKVCDDADCFDHQYWVRDDGKGGQLIKAKCGSDVALQVVDRATNSPLYAPDIRVKLYVVNGQQLAASGLGEPAGGLHLSDDGHPLFVAAGAAAEQDRGVGMDIVQDERLGPVAHIPELQFLDKNSKFKVGGRTFKCFKLLARAVRRDPATGQEVALAQVESETFKVTTKKGYDGCRKAEYLYAHDPITDKTFANLGETTISNLKANFEGVETVEDLMQLVQACRSQPDMELRLRETLNMARDVEKWRNLIRMLSEKVVWDDSMCRLFVVPTGGRPLGLLYRAAKGQVDFNNPFGVLLSPPMPSGQLRVARLTERLQLSAGRHLEALRLLASSYWKFMRHPGWALAPDTPVWEEASAGQLVEAFGEVLGSGDPAALVDMHITAILQQQQLAAAAASPLLRTGTPGLSGGGGGLMPPMGLCGLALDSSGGWGPAGMMMGQQGLQVQPQDFAAAAAAAAAAGSVGTGAHAMSVSGHTSSPMGPLPGADEGVDSAERVGPGGLRLPAAPGGFKRPGVTMGNALSLPAHIRSVSGGPTITTAPINLGPAPSAPGAMGGGLMLPAVPPVGAAGGASPFAIPAGAMAVSARTGSTGYGDSESMMAQQQQQQLLAASGGLSSSVAHPGVVSGGLLAAAGPGQGLHLGRTLTTSAGTGGGGPSSGGGSTAAAMAAARQSSSGSGQAGVPQQQQGAGGLGRHASHNTLLLQQAIIEGWPAAQVKAVLDQMSDEELRELVAQQPSTAAGVLASAGECVTAMDAPAGAQQQQWQQQQQVQQMDVQQMAPLDATGGGFNMQMTVGPPSSGGTAQQQQQAAAAAGTAGTAAAALAALFADADGGGSSAAAAVAAAAAGGSGKAGAAGDVTLTADQAADFLNLSIDSFSDPAQWGDLLENLRQLSSSTSGPGPGLTGLNSLSTDWIPELLGRLESETKEREAREKDAAAAAAAGATAAAAAAGGEDSDDDGGGGERRGPAGRKAKRERSKTAQAPSAEQLAQLQALFASGDPGSLRSISKTEAHFGSFNRHFPTARISSQLQDVAQGTQVSNPWHPGMPMSAAGVPVSPTQDAAPSSIAAGGSGGGRAPVTTPAPQQPHAATRVVSASAGSMHPPAGRPGLAPTTEAGAAAVAAVTGLTDGLQPSPDVSSDLLQVLGVINEDGTTTTGVQDPAAATHGGYLAPGPLKEEGGYSPRALNTPFLSAGSAGVAENAAATVHAPTTQRDSSGKAGWISSLFRSGSSWSSKGSGSFGASGSSKGNGSFAATGSGQMHSGGSNSSKPTAGSGGGSGGGSGTGL